MLEEAKNLKLSELVSDIFEDIGNGICGLQTLRNGKMLKTEKNKLLKYQPKTPIPKIINDLLIPLLNEIRIEKQWHNEKEFVSNEMKVTLIKWCNDDGCIIKYDNGNEMSVNKKFFRSLYESRNKPPQEPEYEQIKLII